jgi:hypothetical protein
MYGLNNVKFARSPDGVGPRCHAELAEDGLGVAMNGVV